MKCYDSNYSEKWAPYPQSFRETVVAAEITKATLSWLGVALKCSWQVLTLMAPPSTAGLGSCQQRRHQEQDFDSPSYPHRGLSQSNQGGYLDLFAEDQPTDLQSFRLKAEKQRAANCLDKTGCYVGYTRHDNRLYYNTNNRRRGN